MMSSHEWLCWRILLRLQHLFWCLSMSRVLLLAVKNKNRGISCRLTCVEFCQESRSGTVHVRTELNPEAVCRCQVAGESGSTVSADQSTVNISLPQLHVVIVTRRMMKNIERSVKRRIISKYITCVILEYVRRIDNQACQLKKIKYM